MSIPPTFLSHADEMTLIRAYEHLEYPSFAARLSNVVGTPIEMAWRLLPTRWYQTVHRRAELGIGKALDLVAQNLLATEVKVSQDRRYKLMGAASGVMGGFFGTPGLLVELPVVTTIMLGTIADIARSEGEDLSTLEARMACLEVFALGGRSDADDAADTGYYGLRLALAVPIVQASRFLLKSGPARGNPPALINLVRKLTERFGVVLSKKAMAEVIPIVGAVGGAFVNSVFIQHFQDMARSHFSIRRLERQYGVAAVYSAYHRIRQGRPPRLLDPVPEPAPGLLLKAA